MDWQPFVRPGRRVAVLPGRRHPRLVILADGLRGRWRGSALYPASRLRARVFRTALRVRSALWPALVQAAEADDASDVPLEALLDDLLPEAEAAAVLLGTPGPAEKATVELWNERREVVGYLKYGEREAARRRLRQEWDLLRALPQGVGPKPLAFRPWRTGLALLTAPLPGNPVPARVPPSEPVTAFCRRLETGAPVELSRHPWVLETAPHRGVGDALEVLEDSRWPVVLQHGDLAAWNLRVHAGAVAAFDWEYGTRRGFPGLDLAYYILQTGALIYRWKPEDAARRAGAFLARSGRFDLNQARAVVRLAAFDAHRKAAQDGHPGSFPIQRWRERIWKP